MADVISESAADKTLSNETLYNQWASTYDTDGNVLQAVDDLQMREKLPKFVQLVEASSKDNESDKLNILDFGCGTGRNTLKLLQVSWSRDVQIEAWDASQGMLDVAKMKCERDSKKALSLSFHLIDFSERSRLPSSSMGSFNAVISTLVLEHLPARAFFSALAAVLKSGGYALVSNMHSGMGALTRAGYKTQTGERIKGTSYVYTVDNAIEAAKQEGLEVVSMAADDALSQGVQEVEVSADMVNGGLVGVRGKKWIGTKIWFGMVLRKT